MHEAKIAESEEMTITVPIPHKLLSPNARVHYMAKAKVVAKTRADAKLAAIAAFNEIGVDPPKFSSPGIRCFFYRKTKRRVDPDNAIASLKPILDGFGDAGVWVDDRELTIFPVVSRVDSKNPRLEIEVEECS